MDNFRENVLQLTREVYYILLTEDEFSNKPTQFYVDYMFKKFMEPFRNNPNVSKEKLEFAEDLMADLILTVVHIETEDAIKDLMEDLSSPFES